MTAFQPVGLAHREVAEIDALLRALGDLRHWSASAAARKVYRDDQGRRLYATAVHRRDEAWVNSLDAAYRLFEIDAIHDSWVDAGGRPD
jgi:hypothetical protein